MKDPGFIEGEIVLFEEQKSQEGFSKPGNKFSLSNLTWTHNPPNKEGYYWRRMGGKGSGRVVLVRECKRGSDSWFYEYSESRYGKDKRIYEDHTQWAGPIPEPEG